MDTMQAAFHVDANKLELREVSVPQPGPDEALVAVKAVTWCGSDKHDMETPPRSHRIPGHEFAGVIAAGGGGTFREGDEVAVDPVISCGSCEACQAGMDHLCPHIKVYGCRGDQPPGALAQYALVKLKSLVPKPKGLPFEQTALGDPLGVALHSLDLAGDLRGKTLAVMGAGAIGLMLAQDAVRRGATRIMLVDVDDHHLGVGEELGDFEIFNAMETEKTLEALREARPHVIAELAGGNTPTLDWAVQTCRRGGTVLMIGQRPHGVTLNYPLAMFNELRLQGVFAKTAKNFRDAVDMMAAGEIDVAKIITHRFPLNEVQASFDRCLQPGALKVVTTP